MKTLKIPVLNHLSGCVQYYNVNFKRVDETSFTTLSPNPTTDTILIPNLTAGDYDIQISRLCCNGSISAPLNISYTIT